MTQSLNHPFSVSSSAGRLAVERDYERYVKALIHQVLMTRPGERINRPEFGCGLRSLVFSLMSESAANLAQTSIYTALRNELAAFVRVDDVRVEFEQPSTMRIHVVYLILATSERRFLNMEVTE